MRFRAFNTFTFINYIIFYVIYQLYKITGKPGSLTWLILEVEDGHDVIGEIKHWKHSHFGEDLGKFAQIQNRQHLHIACLTPIILCYCCDGYYLIQARSLDQRTPPARHTDSPQSPPASTVEA